MRRQETMALFIVGLAVVPALATGPRAAAQTSPCGVLLSSFDASVGDSITVTGAGFGHGTTVTFLVDGVPFTTGTAVSDGSGDGTVGFVSVQFPATEEGSFLFQASGTAGGAPCETLPVGPVLVFGPPEAPTETSTPPQSETTQPGPEPSPTVTSEPEGSSGTTPGKRGVSTEMIGLFGLVAAGGIGLVVINRGRKHRLRPPPDDPGPGDSPPGGRGGSQGDEPSNPPKGDGIRAWPDSYDRIDSAGIPDGPGTDDEASFGRFGDRGSGPGDDRVPPAAEPPAPGDSSGES